ncbi:hypothetical protein ACFV9E_06645 [Streptomyces sp. NPDC059835]|uniref:hypothetical protein n=1 Tax=Streptomyces sp. NPDC059835 TaxID=3346967 RepID=UPI00364C3F29
MPWETVAEEIARLEAERHLHSATFANTSPSDAVTRAHLQQEMDRRTARIQELQQQRPLGFLTRWLLRSGALAAAWGAIEFGPWWIRTGLGLLAAGLAFYSLG